MARMVSTMLLAAAASASARPAAITRSSHETPMGAPLPQTWWGAPRQDRPRSKLEPAGRPASRRLQANAGDWPQDRFDIANSGSTTYIGPGDVNGFCRAAVLTSSLLDPNAELLSSTGVTSTNGFDFWFGAGSTNVLHMVQLIGNQNWTRWDLNLTYINRAQPNAPAAYPATPYGVVSAGASWAFDLADTIAIPSSDGSVYALWYLNCINSVQGTEGDGQGSTPASGPGQGTSYSTGPGLDQLSIEGQAMEVVPPQPVPGANFDPALAATVYRVNPKKAQELTRAQKASAGTQADEKTTQSSDGLDDPFPACVQWVAQLAGGNKPSFGPTRYIDPDPNTGRPALVLATESDPFVDTAGVLHAFNAATGAELWNFPAIDPQGTSWGFVGTVPAVDSSRSWVIFVTYGATLTALNPLTGKQLASLNISGLPDTADPADYIYRQGYLDSGDDLFYGNLTYAQAVAYCNGQPTCAGFTHNAPDIYPTYPTAFWIKSALKFSPSNTGWSTFQRPGFGVDPFVSSPVLSPTRDAVFVHSAAGTAWRINIAGDGVSTLTMAVAWGCDFIVNAPNGYTPCLSPPAVYRRQLPAPVYTQEGRVLEGDVSEGQALYRGDYVAGGWYQPTTRAHRDELYSAIAHAHAQLTAGSGAAQDAGVPAPTGSGSAGLYGGVSGIRPTPLPTEGPVASTGTSTAPLTPQRISTMLRELQAAGRLSQVQAMRTASGYTKLGRDGRAVYSLAESQSSNPQQLQARYGSIYPYSVPTVDANSVFLLDALIISQYLPYERGDEGVFAVLIETGDIVWSMNSWDTSEGLTLYFGRSRSSPTLDGDSFVYVAADIDDPHSVGRNSSASVPALFALDLIDGSLSWATTMGFGRGMSVGHASPVVVDGFMEANAAFMAVDHGLVYLTEGEPCPTDNEVYECSGYGRCDCNTGTCTCDPNNLCIGGLDCAPRPCVHGVCYGYEGICNCDPCFTGAACDQPVTCGANAACSVSTGNCTCNNGYIPNPAGGCMLPSPSASPTPSKTSKPTMTATAAATSTATASSSTAPAAAIPTGTAPNPGSVAAGVLVGIPAVMMGLGAAYIALFKYQNPLKPWHDALPTAVQRKLGLSGYLRMTPGVPSAASSSGSSASSPGKGGASPKVKGGLAAVGFTSSMPTIVKGNNADSMARAKLLSAARGPSAGGLASKGGGSYGAV